VKERWASFTDDEREALLRFGHKRAPWESTPDTALRILKCDPKLRLRDVEMLGAIFHTAYKEIVGDA
jgi:hypothetical protein